MSIVEKYIVDGRVEREAIAMDIKNGKLSKREVDEILADERVQKAFIGADFSDETPQEQWDSEYLDRLSYAVVSEAFNRAYIEQLFKVSSFVRGKTNTERSQVSQSARSVRGNRPPVHHSRKKRKGCILVPFLVLLGIGIVAFISLTRG